LSYQEFSGNQVHKLDPTVTRL